MYLIRGSWNMLTLYCGHHEIPVEMQIDSGYQNITYSCSHEEIQNGRTVHCPNKIKLAEYEEILGCVYRTRSLKRK